MNSHEVEDSSDWNLWVPGLTGLGSASSEVKEGDGQ